MVVLFSLLERMGVRSSNPLPLSIYIFLSLSPSPPTHPPSGSYGLNGKSDCDCNCGEVYDPDCVHEDVRMLVGEREEL